MATRRPLVVINGTAQELPVGDTVAGAPAGGGGGGSVITSGSATLDFGSGSNEATASVTGQTGLLTSSSVWVWVRSDDTTATHTANDHKYFPMLCSMSVEGVTADVGFTINAVSPHKLTGQFLVRFSWST